MKKIISIVLVLACIVTVGIACFAKAGDKLGDVNNDGKINAQDYIKVKRHCLRTYTLSDEEFERADVTLDNKINAQDYIKIKRHCLRTYVITGVVGGDESSTPESSTPESSTPESSTPESSTPESSTPESSTPESSKPESSTPETSNPTVNPSDCAHNVKTLRGAYEPTKSTDGYFGDLYCVYCNTKLFTGSYYSYDDYVYTFNMPNGGTVKAPLSVNIIEYTLALAGKQCDCDCTYIEQEILRLCNIEREKVGLHPLEMMENAHYFTDIRAEDCFESFAHTRPDGERWDTVYSDANVVLSCTWGENLVYIGSSNTLTADYVAQRFVELWMNSEGHRANILDPDYDYMAVGVKWKWDEEMGRYRYTGVQHFFGWFDEE